MLSRLACSWMSINWRQRSRASMERRPTSVSKIVLARSVSPFFASAITSSRRESRSAHVVSNRSKSSFSSCEMESVLRNVAIQSWVRGSSLRNFSSQDGLPLSSRWEAIRLLPSRSAISIFSTRTLRRFSWLTSSRRKSTRNAAHKVTMLLRIASTATPRIVAENLVAKLERICGPFSEQSCARKSFLDSIIPERSCQWLTI